MVLKEQSLRTDLQRENPFIVLTSLISHEILNINTIRIILVGCLVPSSIEININSLLPSKAAINFIGEDRLLFVYSASYRPKSSHTQTKDLHLGKNGMCSISMCPSLVQALTLLQGEKCFESLNI